MATKTGILASVVIAALIGGGAATILVALQSRSSPMPKPCNDKECNVDVSFSWGGIGGLQVDAPVLVVNGVRDSDVDIVWRVRDGFEFRAGGVVFKFPDDANAGQFDQLYPVDDRGTPVDKSPKFHWRAKKGSVGTFLYNVTVFKVSTGVAYGPLDPAIRNQGR